MKQFGTGLTGPISGVISYLHVCTVWRRGGKEQDLEGLSKRLWRMVLRIPKLKEQMEHCVDHLEEISKLSKWKKMSVVEERVRVAGEKVRVADEKVRVKE
ncbi:hypothetical protein Hanom_Chr04g00347531 [Helianthus anomalus]